MRCLFDDHKKNSVQLCYLQHPAKYDFISTKSKTLELVIWVVFAWYTMLVYSVFVNFFYYLFFVCLLVLLYVQYSQMIYVLNCRQWLDAAFNRINTVCWSNLPALVFQIVWYLNQLLGNFCANFEKNLDSTSFSREWYTLTAVPRWKCSDKL